MSMLTLAFLACAPDTADVSLGESAPCEAGFERRGDGACYEVGTDTGGDDTDTAGDTDTDTDTDTGADTDTAVDLDVDGDGFDAGEDCDDTRADVNPGAAEVAWNEVDEDCDGADLHDWIDISIGCGIDSTGAARCWGDNVVEYGLDEPRRGPFTRIVSDGAYACALDATGVVTCWGTRVPDLPATAWLDLDESSGVTATGAVWIEGAFETGFELPLAGYRRAAAGTGFACAVAADASIDCWGYDIAEIDQHGQDVPPRGDFTDVAAGSNFACGLGVDGTIACWGDTYAGVSTPPEGTFTAVSASGDGACAVRADEGITCWGEDDGGELTPPAGAFERVVVAGSFTCGLRVDGGAECWGLGGAGLDDIP